ncbi:hypothetical protein Hte_007672 [Hypoxylon texense]
MKFIALLSLSATFAVGHVLSKPKTSLVARAGQSLTNPDNEPDFEDVVTGDKTPKSRVLSGIGPEEADNRWFDWDESCSNADQRTKILAAFRHIIQLSDATSGHLDELQKGLPKPVGKSTNKDNKKYIFDTDPAYAQMFLGLDDRIQYVKDTFDLVRTKANAPPDARGGGKPGALRFICNANNEVMTGDGKEPYCGTGENAAQAIATIPYNPAYKPTIEPKYSFEKSSSITFCPVFFNNDAFPNIDVVAGFGEHTLDKIDCAERVLLHEYMHLAWIRNMPGAPDYIGYFKAADFARVGKWGSIKGNPDN